ncbi:hypothetical protein [Candidatus Nitrospira bockiana]
MTGETHRVSVEAETLLRDNLARRPEGRDHVGLTCSGSLKEMFERSVTRWHKTGEKS